MIPTGQEEEEENQGIIHTSQLITERGATRSTQELRRSMGSPWQWQFWERAMLHHGFRSVWRIGLIGWAVKQLP